MSVTFTSPNDGKIQIRIHANASNNALAGMNTTFSAIQLEIGTVATPYTPYKGNETPILSPPIYDLPNGVKDTPDMSRTALFTLNGTQTPIASFVQGDYFLAQFLPVIPAKPSFGYTSSAICDKLKVAQNWLINIESFLHGSANNNAFQIKVLSSRLPAATNAGLNTYLSANPITFVYERTTYVPRTPDRLFVTTYQGETNISIIDNVQTTFTAVAKSELESNRIKTEMALAGKLNASKIANNDLTTEEGYAWYARRGKAVRDDLNIFNNKMVQENILHNGNFDVWQRGITATNLGFLKYLADLCANVTQDFGTSPNTITSRQKTTSLASSKYVYRVQWDGNVSGQGASFRHMITQFIENGYSLYIPNGEKITLSFKARSNIAGKKIAVNLHERYGSSDIVNLNGKSFSLTSEWQNITYTWTPQVITDTGLTEDDSLAVQIYFAWGTTYAQRFEGITEDHRQAGYVDIAEVRLVQGDTVKTVLKRTFKEELDYCKRFCQKSWDYNAAVGSGVPGGCDGITCGDNNAKTLLHVKQLEVEMYAPPTVTLYDSAGTINTITTKDTNNSPTFGVTPTVGATQIGTKCFKVNHTGAIAGIGYHWTTESQLA